MASGCCENYLVVAAIDFGTTFSGYAFSTRHAFQKDPQDISSIVWTAGSGCLQSQKTSTCVLFDPAGEFDSFGFEAEDKYSDLAYDNKHHDWYYFRRFKMELFEQKVLNRNFQLVAHNQRKMPAVKVIAACISYLKDRMLDKCHERGFDVSVGDIKWVITIPAIWTEPAKQFMREAAEQAGLQNANQLMLSLEPEAASLWCKHLPVEKDGTGGCTFNAFDENSRYMIVDAGGGTVDITFHEVQRNGKLKEFEKANGGHWGGTVVDEEFEKFLCEILGEKVFQYFLDNYVVDMVELRRSFEIKKRTISAKTKGKVTFMVPSTLHESFRNFNKNKDIMSVIESTPKYAGKIDWKLGKLRIDADIFISFFDVSLQCISKHISQLLQDPKIVGIKAILMVGGYSECPLLQDCIKSIASGVRVIVPQDSGLAVLKGAVVNGHVPNTITERICRYTYGVSSRIPFIEGVHKEEYKKISYRGNTRCKNIFQTHVKIGDTVKEEEACKHRRHKVIKPHQTRMILTVCASTSESPMYTTDESCINLGKIIIKLPDTTLGMKRGADVAMVFGGTEIQVVATDFNTGEKQTAYFDFLG